MQCFYFPYQASIYCVDTWHAHGQLLSQSILTGFWVIQDFCNNFNPSISQISLFKSYFIADKGLFTSSFINLHLNNCLFHFVLLVVNSTFPRNKVKDWYRLNCQCQNIRSGIFQLCFVNCLLLIFDFVFVHSCDGCFITKLFYRFLVLVVLSK
jgi:hypothetical protein